MEAQNKVTRRHLDRLADRVPLAARMKEVFYTEARSVPVVRGKRLFFTARAATQEKEALFWRDLDGKDHLLLDPNAWPTSDNPSLAWWEPSRDGTKLAYGIALHNADESSLHVIDVASGVESARDAIANMDEPGPSWSADGKGFFYRYGPPPPAGTPISERPGLVDIRYHRLGEDPSHDRVVRPKTGDPTIWLTIRATHDGHWLFSTEWRSNSARVSFLDLRAKDAQWKLLADYDRGKNYPYAYRDRIYLLSNDGAPNWRVFAVEPARPERATWKEIVAERPDARLQSMNVVGGKLAIQYYKDVTTRLEVRSLSGAFEREIAIPALGTASTPDGDPNADEAFFSYSSFTHTPEIQRVSITRGATTTWWRASVPADLSRFEVEQVFYASKDGTRVPMFVVHAKEIKRDGSAPMLLEGYGGFDITYGPEWYSPIIPWLERGGAYAWADIRGGGEYGESWHTAGMLHAKQNVFDDFIAAAEYLVAQGYTSRGKLVAMSSSNGGLLMGAMITQRPDLFRVIICGAPLLDMVRFHLFGAGKLWIDEYGNPDDEADFRALHAYSPLHRVHDGERYPSLIVMSPANDDRVDPMHARKFVAAMQAASNGGPALLRIEPDAGHFGGGSRAARVAYYADAFAFTLAEIGEVGGAVRP
jgi:prolyl oligopeptidase